MKQPLVSVIIPCYNVEQYVGEAIDSALNQTYPAVEVIAINDGSTDGTLNVLNSYGERIRSETSSNRGACAARNRGLELAQGELVQFLDADDMLWPNKLEQQVPVLINGTADVVHCDVEAVDAATGEPLEHYEPNDTDSFRRCCFDSITTPGPLHRKSVILRMGGFDSELPCSQEYDLHLRMACHGVQFHYWPETLVTVRRRPDGLSTDYVNVLSQFERIIPRAADILDSEGLSSDEKRRCLAEVLARAATHLLDRGAKDKSRALLVLARQLHRDGGLTVFSTLRRFAYRAIGVPYAHRIANVFSRLRSQTYREARQTD